MKINFQNIAIEASSEEITTAFNELIVKAKEGSLQECEDAYNKFISLCVAGDIFKPTEDHLALTRNKQQLFMAQGALTEKTLETFTRWILEKRNLAQGDPNE
jgi:hypothetical protein